MFLESHGKRDFAPLNLLQAASDGFIAGYAAAIHHTESLCPRSQRLASLIQEVVIVFANQAST